MLFELLWQMHIWQIRKTYSCSKAKANILTTVIMYIFPASGEPPLCLSCCTLFSIKNAIHEARSEAGDKQFFRLGINIILNLSEPFSIVCHFWCVYWITWCNHIYLVYVLDLPATVESAHNHCLNDVSQYVLNWYKQLHSKLELLE